MFLMTLGNIGDLWDAIHETDLIVIGNIVRFLSPDDKDRIFLQGDRKYMIDFYK